MKTMNSRKLITEITLDWDEISLVDARSRVYDILCSDYYCEIENVKWRFSARKGFHIKIELKNPITRQQSYLLRRKFRDDGNRLVLDILRGNQQPKQVLWTKKYDHQHNDIWSQVTDWKGINEL